MSVTARITATGEPTEISTIEVTIVTPRIICVSIKDQPPIAGRFVDTGSDQGTVNNEWVAKTSPFGDAPDFAKVLGPNQHGLLYSSKRPDEYVDRVTGKVATNWKVLGRTLKVDKVFYENDLHHECSWSIRPGAVDVTDVMPANAWMHHFYLKFDADLVSGQIYRIRPPAAWHYEDIIFNYNDRITRAKPLKASFAGWRPNDERKLAYLSQWIPGEANEGAINLHAMGFTSFELINEAGTTVWNSGVIPVGKDPTNPEPLNVFPGRVPATSNYAQRLYPSSEPSKRLTVVSISGTSPATVTLATGEGAKIANNDILYVGYLPTTDGSEMTGLSRWVKVTSKSGDSFVAQRFDVNVNAFIDSDVTGQPYDPSLMAGPTVGALYKTHLSDTAMTWVHQLDFTAFETPGTYRIRIPGLGVSDPFPIAENVWHNAAGHLAKGEYHNRCGHKIDGRFGYTRDWSFRHGKRGVTYHRSNLPSVFSLQGGVIPNLVDYGPTLVHPSSWTTTTEIDAGGEWFDAGDWDVFPSQHLESAYQAMFVYERLHEIDADSVVTDWNLPLSSDANLALGTDIDQAELDGLPEILHQIHYSLDWARRCQFVDGGCPSGIQNRYEAFVASPTGLGELPEVSVAAVSPYWTYAPDHPTNFEFAGLFAQFARILLSRGCTTAGNAYLAAAQAAWNWAEDVYTKTIVATSTTSTAIATGSKTFTLPYNSGLPAKVGDTVRIQSRANTANYMQGTVTSFTRPNELSLVVNVTSVGGSGTFTDWDVVMSGHDEFYYYDALTQIRRSTVRTGNTTSGSAVITGLSSMTGINVGDHCTGAGIRDNMRVKSIDSGSQITLESVYNTYDTAGNLLNPVIPAGATATASGVNLTFKVFSGGWDDAKYRTNLNEVHRRGKMYRLYAAICLFKATGTTAYRDTFERTYLSGDGYGFDLYGMTEYLGAAPFTGVSGANSSIVETIRSNILTDADSLADIVEAHADGFKHMGSGLLVYTAHVYGARVHNILSAPFVAATSGDRERFRKVLLDLMGLIFGANYMGWSWSVGFGPRFKRNMMHIDSQRLHPEGRTADGLVPYGPNFNPEFSLAIPFKSWSDTIPLSSLHHAYSPNETEHRRNQVAEPGRFFRPAHYSFDTRWQVNESEFGMPSIMVNELIAMILHGWDGNSAT